MKCDPLSCASAGDGSADDSVVRVGALLRNQQLSLKQRFRALFTLQNLGGAAAVAQICSAFDDPSALLRHELAYCLGQMGDAAAIERLSHVLADRSEDAMVRHEAGEALGAIGHETALPLLDKMAADSVQEVAETCRLAGERIRWLRSAGEGGTAATANPYQSVDPAPPLDTAECDRAPLSVDQLGAILVDAAQPLWTRYRAMFALRNVGGAAGALALAAALECGDSALLRHEVAYVLGQMAPPVAVSALVARLADPAENYMVRHECAEALGAIGTDECLAVLGRYAEDSCRVVRESCVVALDVADYQASDDQFQYADGLARVLTSPSAPPPTSSAPADHCPVK